MAAYELHRLRRGEIVVLRVVISARAENRDVRMFHKLCHDHKIVAQNCANMGLLYRHYLCGSRKKLSIPEQWWKTSYFHGILKKLQVVEIRHSIEIKRRT